MAKFCTNCGSPVREGAAFCAKCGSQLTPSVPVAPAPVEAAPVAAPVAEPVAPAPVAEPAPVVEPVAAPAPVEAAPAPAAAFAEPWEEHGIAFDASRARKPRSKTWIAGEP